MSKKGLVAQQEHNRKLRAIARGTEKPLEYRLCLAEAIQKAGL